MSAQEGLVDWEKAAPEICEKLLAQMPDVLSRITGDIYERLMRETQDYLQENVEFNLKSQLDAANRQAQADREARTSLESELAEARKREDQLNARLHCMCGSPVDQHGMGGGHSPVSMYDYALERTEAENARLLAVNARQASALQAARTWLEGWASAEPYIALIDAALAGHEQAGADGLRHAVEELLLAVDDNAVAAKDSGGNVVLRGSFIAVVERLRYALDLASPGKGGE